jgi:hypothetical protein
VDLLFIEGVAAVVASIIVFCGSVFLILAMVMGARLAYFVTASITLASILIMGVVWSVNPLGPVGELPEWLPFEIGADPAQIDFAPAADYPDAPWEPVNTEDEVQAALASELEGASTEYLGTAIEEGEIDTFEDESDAIVNSDQTRLLEQGDADYGAVTLEPVQEGQGTSTVIIMRYDHGDPLGPPRIITAGTFVLLALHMFGLSRSEKKARSLSNGPR